MQQLHKIQQQFWHSLRISEKMALNSNFIAKGGKLTPQKRLNIYQRTGRTAHINALAQCYSCCETILGEKYFNQIAMQYFYKYPAINQNLNTYGELFADFLQDFINDHTELEEYPYLPDLARLEKGYEQAYFSINDEPFDFSALSKLSAQEQNNLCLKLSNSIYVLQSDYPIYEIWNANQSDNQHQEIQAINEPQHLCIYRRDFKPIVEIIEPDYWNILKYIQEHISLSKLEEISSTSERKLHIETMIPELIQKNWICGFFIKNSL
jgi:hypothetical protein